MGCCISSQETDVQVKSGEMFKYSILVPTGAKEEWVLTNQETLRNMKVAKSGSDQPQADLRSTTGKMTKIDFQLQAQKPGEETLLFAQYTNGTRDAKAIKKVRVKVL